jgi:hypothetical protein
MLDKSFQQSAPRRAWEDTEYFRKSAASFWTMEIVGAAVLGVIGGSVGFLLTPVNPTPFQQYIYPTFGGATGIIGGFILVFCGIFLAKLFRAPYKQRNEARAELLKTANRPEAKIEVSELLAGSGDFNYPQRGIAIPNIYAAGVRFVNNSTEISAKNVWAKINYFDGKGEIALGSLIASWDEMSGADILPTPVEDIRAVELKPKGPPYTIVLAIKHMEDKVCYACNYENYNYVDLRKPGYKLDREKFVIFVTLFGQNVGGDEFGAGKQFGYILYNYGKGKGLDIKPYTDTKL